MASLGAFMNEQPPHRELEAGLGASFSVCCNIPFNKLPHAFVQCGSQGFHFGCLLFRHDLLIFA